MTTTQTPTLSKRSWYWVEIIAFGLFCFFLGMAVDQGKANFSFVKQQREEVIGDICRRSQSPECQKARQTLDQFPVQQTAPAQAGK